MQTIKNWLRKIYNFFFGTKDSAKTAAVKAAAKEKVDAAKEKTTEVVSEANEKLDRIAKQKVENERIHAERMEAIKARNERSQACHQAVLRLIDHLGHHGLSMKEVMAARDRLDLERLMEIEGQVQQGTYKPQPIPKAQGKKVKAKHINPKRNIQYA